ncbi:hypothetical protein J7J83_02755 [bacterium]|nr:hypothetical protein [bacterium]
MKTNKSIEKYHELVAKRSELIKATEQLEKKVFSILEKALEDMSKN